MKKPSALVVSIVLLSLVAGCTTTTTNTTVPPTATGTRVPPTAPPAATATPPEPTTTATTSPVLVETVRFTTEDDVTLAGTLFGEGEFAVLLAHQGTTRTDQQSWQPFAQLIAQKGFTALTFDFRGRGQSEGTLKTNLLVYDVNAAIRFLRDRGYDRIICMGASMGGTACARAALDNELAGLAVIASTMSNGAPTEVKPEDLPKLTMPKLFVVAEGEHSLVVQDTTRMFELSPEPKQFKSFAGRYEHGTYLFGTPVGDEFRDLLVNFLEDVRAGKLTAGATTPGVPFPLTRSTQEFPGTGTFQIGLGDLNGDGDLDAVFANPMKSYSQVWLNDGNGQFTDTGQRLTQYGHGVGVADLDGDGDLDAFITCHQFVTPSRVYLNDGKANLQDTGQDLGDAGISAADLELVDVNGDGHMDAHVMYFDPQGKPDKVYLNDGTGTFSDSGLALDEYVIAWGDLDGDGDVDLLGKRYGEGYVVRLNDGAGQFSEGWQMADSQAKDGDIALADFDGDGDLDALVANGFRTGGSHPSILLWNDGHGQFTDSGQRLNATIVAELGVGDLDGDGDLDVFVSNMDLPNEVWLNDGAGHLVDSGLRLGKKTDASARPSLGDLDGDGDLDVFVGSLMGPPEIWFNDTPTGPGTRGDGLYLGQKPPGLGVEVFAPGVVSIEDGKEYKIAFSPDLQEIVFTRRTPKGRDDHLWTCRLENGKLTVPELVPFAYDTFETDACFTPDGTRLYFNSARPLPGETAMSRRLNVWFVDRIETGWSEPRFLDSPLNDYQPVYFSFADNGTLYFTRSNPRGIYYAEPEDGQYLEAQKLPHEINYVREVAHPAIAPDESYIVVDSAYERGSRLVGFLYVSFRMPDGSWTRAVSLHDALKASESDVYAAPRISPDGKYLFFERYEASSDRSDIYWVSTAVVEALKAQVLP